jgi:hypothetical protein
LANTPLNAAHPPLAIASISHAGRDFGRDMIVYVAASRNMPCDGWGWGKLHDLQGTRSTTELSKVG